MRNPFNFNKKIQHVLCYLKVQLKNVTQGNTLAKCLLKVPHFAVIRIVLMCVSVWAGRDRRALCRCQKRIRLDLYEAIKLSFRIYVGVDFNGYRDFTVTKNLFHNKSETPIHNLLRLRIYSL